MGLSGARNKRKLDYDPNNTRWSRDESTFGQKILRAQGWEPGQFLGAQGSSHAHLHTAASSAPIKINLKDDTLGLGAKVRQKQSDECTGLVGFKDLLGRLNGKSEESIQKEKQVRSELKTSLFVERRYGPMRFVSGGLLVGEDMTTLESVKKDLPSTVSEKGVKEETSNEPSGLEPTQKQKKEKKSKKRKAGESEVNEIVEAPREKKRKKQSKASATLEDEDSHEAQETGEKREKKQKKKSKHSKEPGEEEVESTKAKKSKRSKKLKDVSDQTESSASIATDSKKSEAKQRKSKKEKRRKEKAEPDTSGDAAPIPASAVVAVSQASGSSTPTATGTSTPQILSNRHLARSRNIASKRMAIADMQALNQIFMVKAV
ncbi:hypothetical protein GGR56DRAFT_620955 [Xylariaceae sp. FL0804]|nr:hypothetical protein GGR56DRAFT_620955 [Xylariaceae sp. FL0804]